MSIIADVIGDKDFKKLNVYRYPPLDLLSDSKGNSLTLKDALSSKELQQLGFITDDLTKKRFSYDSTCTVPSQLGKLINEGYGDIWVYDSPSCLAPCKRTKNGLTYPYPCRLSDKDKEKLTKVYRDSLEIPEKSKLSIPFGRNMLGQYEFKSLESTGNILIRGMRKSERINLIKSFISALLCTNSPDELKLILIDPKREELTDSNGICHLLTPIIVEPEKILSGLKWVMAETDRRNKLFQSVGVKNIQSYNDLSGFHALPNVVIFLDDPADMFMFGPVEIEGALIKILEHGKRGGIYLVISNDEHWQGNKELVNYFPTKIYFKTNRPMIYNNLVNPQKLIEGDYLITTPSDSQPQYLQSLIVTTQEVRNLVNFLKSEDTSQNASLQSGIPSKTTEEDAYEKFLEENKSIIDSFCEIAKRKVSYIDEYGTEDWEILGQEKWRCLTKIALKYGLSGRFIQTLQIEIQEGESSGLSPKNLASTMGQSLRYALEQINPDYLPYAEFLIKLYFFDLDNIFKNYYQVNQKEDSKLDINSMTGIEFEAFIQQLLIKEGL